MPETGTIEEIYTSPKKVEWTISNFFLLPKRLGHFVASPKFYFREYSCRLIVLPNGTDSLPNTMMVTVTGIGKAGNVRWELEILRIDHTVLRTCGGWKRHDCEVDMTMLIPYKEVETGCYIRGFLKITCTLHSEDPERPGKWFKEIGLQTEDTSRTDKLSGDLEELFRREDDSDLIIRVQGQEFKAHKNILRFRTPVFTSMFKYKMSENITGVIEIEDCDAITFREFLYYLYTGRVEKFSPSTVFDLHQIADKYEVLELKEYCLEYIKNNLTVDMFCDSLLLSAQYDDEELMETAKKFLSENMAEIMDTDKWQNFLSENPSASNALLLEALKLQKQRNEDSIS